MGFLDRRRILVGSVLRVGAVVFSVGIQELYFMWYHPGPESIRRTFWIFDSIVVLCVTSGLALSAWVPLPVYDCFRGWKDKPWLHAFDCGLSAATVSGIVWLMYILDQAAYHIPYGWWIYYLLAETGIVCSSVLRHSRVVWFYWIQVALCAAIAVFLFAHTYAPAWLLKLAFVNIALGTVSEAMLPRLGIKQEGIIEYS